MTHIAKTKLDPAHFKLLSGQMNTIISLLNKNSSQDFFDELLGVEEKIMLMKRLSAIVMFIEGNSSYRVWQLLQLSPSTAERIRLNYECGKYQNIEKILKQHKPEYEKFWKILELILSAGLPPRGRGRWKSVFERVL